MKKRISDTLIAEELPKEKECQRRWKEGRMNVVCGEPLPCPKHGGITYKQEILNTELDINDVAEIDVKKIHNCICGDVVHSIDDCELADKIVTAIAKAGIIKWKPREE